MRSAHRRLLAGLLAFSCLACAGLLRGPDPTVSGAEPPAAPAARVILVTLDGVRWQEIFGGVDPDLAEAAGLPRRAMVPSAELLPHLHRLFFEQGVVLGDPRLEGGISASGRDHVSLPGYFELVTGAATPCTSNTCAFQPATTIADEVAASSRPGPDGAAVFSSWEEIARAATAGSSRVRVRAGREPGDQAPAYPGSGAYRPDRVTAALALRTLREDAPRFLWIALGDTDEWAHRRDYRGYLEALRAGDAFLGELAQHLVEMGDDTRTAVLVTTDHGRDATFADHGGASSAPVWLLARGPSIVRAGAVATRARRHLRDVAPTVRALLGLAPRTCAECGEVISELFPPR